MSRQTARLPREAALQWDSASSSPFFNYHTADGSSHVVWYEDEKSIPLETALVFALGYGDLKFWRAIAPADSEVATPLLLLFRRFLLRTPILMQAFLQ